MTGAAIIIATPAFSGNPFFIKPLTIGIIAHSQTGRKNPINAAGMIAKYMFLGISFRNTLSGTKVCIMEDIMIPSIIKGIASRMILKKTVLNVKN
jgi:hypothetical protein